MSGILQAQVKPQPVTKRALRDESVGSDGLTAGEALARCRWGAGGERDVGAARLRVGVALLAQASSGAGTCRGFVRFNRCKYGAACRYSHEYLPLSTSDLAAHERVCSTGGEAVHVVRVLPLSNWRLVEATLGISALVFLQLLPEGDGSPRFLWSAFAKDKELWTAAGASPVSSLVDVTTVAAENAKSERSPLSASLRPALDGLPEAALARVVSCLPPRSLSALARVSRALDADLNAASIWLPRLQEMPLWHAGIARGRLAWQVPPPSQPVATLAMPATAAVLTDPFTLDNGVALRRAYFELMHVTDWAAALRVMREVVAFRVMGAFRPQATDAAALPQTLVMPGEGGDNRRRSLSARTLPTYSGGGGSGGASLKVARRRAAASPLKDDESGETETSSGDSDTGGGGRRSGSNSKGYRHPWEKSSSATNPRKKASKAALRRAAAAASSLAGPAASAFGTTGSATVPAPGVTLPPRHRASRGSATDTSVSDDEIADHSGRGGTRGGSHKSRHRLTPTSPASPLSPASPATVVGDGGVSGLGMLDLALPAPALSTLSIATIASSSSVSTAVSPALSALRAMQDGLLRDTSPAGAVARGILNSGVALPLPWQGIDAEAVTTLQASVGATANNLSTVHDRALKAMSVLSSLREPPFVPAADDRGPTFSAAATLARIAANSCGGTPLVDIRSVPAVSSLWIAASGMAFVDSGIVGSDDVDAALGSSDAPSAPFYNVVAPAGASESLLRQPPPRRCGVGGLGASSALGIVRGGLGVSGPASGLTQPLRALALGGGGTLAAIDGGGAVRVWAGDGTRLAAGRCSPARDVGSSAGAFSACSAADAQEAARAVSPSPRPTLYSPQVTVMAASLYVG